MRAERGTTMFEVVTALAVVAVLAAVAVPGAARVRAGVSGAEAARCLALVLRSAQAEAQSRGGRVLVEVAGDGDYRVTAAGQRLASGRLGAAVQSTYPGGALEFSARGWAALPGAASPRAGHFTVAGASSTRTVVVQLSGVRAMHVRPRPVAGGLAGFSLLEAVVAAGLLLTTVAAVTVCVTGVSRAGARLERTMRADRATLAVAERLRQLPYCAATYPVRVGETPAADLVAAVFPHAATWRSTATARYVAAAGDPQAAAGSFVTVVVEQGVRVTCVARFLAGLEGAPLGPAELAGWDLATSPRPPAPALEIVVSSAAQEGSGSGARSVRLARGALGPVLAARGPEGGG